MDRRIVSELKAGDSGFVRVPLPAVTFSAQGWARVKEDAEVHPERKHLDMKVIRGCDGVLRVDIRAWFEEAMALVGLDYVDAEISRVQ